MLQSLFKLASMEDLAGLGTPLFVDHVEFQHYNVHVLRKNTEYNTLFFDDCRYKYCGG